MQNGGGDEDAGSWSGEGRDDLVLRETGCGDGSGLDDDGSRDGLGSGRWGNLRRQWRVSAVSRCNESFGAVMFS